jgi:uncharacterized protein (TIGR00661 family)
MKVVLGVCGLGFGHSIRQSCVLEVLLESGCSVVVFAYASSYLFFKEYFRQSVHVVNVSVPWVASSRNGIDLAEIWERNRSDLGTIFTSENRAFAEAIRLLGGLPDLCISDYEPVTAKFAYLHDVPLVTIDQQSKFLGYQTEDANGFSRNEERSRLAYFFPYAKQRLALSYLAVDAAPDPQYEVTLVPAIVRTTVRKLAERPVSPESRLVVVYLSPYDTTGRYYRELFGVLKRFKNFEFHIYDQSAARYRRKSARLPSNIVLRPFDEQGFLTAVWRARGVISTSGFTLLSELAFLGKPVFTVPFATYDQNYYSTKNQELGFGMAGRAVDEEKVGLFLERTPTFAANLRAYQHAFSRKHLRGLILDLVARHSQGASRRQLRYGTSELRRNAEPLYPPRKEGPRVAPDGPDERSYRTAVLKPTLACSCRCAFCSSRAKGWWTEDARSMGLDSWRRVIDQLRHLGFERVNLSGGEPLLFPQLPQLVEHIRSCGLVASLNTNGSLLTESKLRRLVAAGLSDVTVSLDFPSPHLHDEARNRMGVWQEARAATRMCVALRDEGGLDSIAIRTVLTRGSLHELHELLRSAITWRVSRLKLSYLECADRLPPLRPDRASVDHLRRYVLPLCVGYLRASSLPAGNKAFGRKMLARWLFPPDVIGRRYFSEGRYWAHPMRVDCTVPGSLLIIYGDGTVLPCNAFEYRREAVHLDPKKPDLAAALRAEAFAGLRRRRPEICGYCPMPLHLSLPLYELAQDELDTNLPSAIQGGGGGERGCS